MSVAAVGEGAMCGGEPGLFSVGVGRGAVYGGKSSLGSDGVDEGAACPETSVVCCARSDDLDRGGDGRSEGDAEAVDAVNPLRSAMR